MEERGSSSRSKNITVGDGLTPEAINHEIEQEVKRLFDEYDQDGSGHIDTGSELETMVSRLRKKGFVFTKKISDDDATSIYKPARSARIKLQVLQGFEPGEAEDGISYTEFCHWFKNEVCSRRTNLRIIIGDLEWLDDVLLSVFKQADRDDSGSVDVNELRQFLCKVASSLGEPAPSDKEVNRMIEKADESHDGTLGFDEFKFVVVEISVRLYYTHFNDTMNIHVRGHA